MNLKLNRNPLVETIHRLSSIQSDGLKLMARKVAASTMAALLMIGGVVQANAATAPATRFSDSFEGTKIYPYWTLAEDYGTITLSKDQAYSGTHSLKLAATSAGGQRSLTAIHKLPAATKGTVSIAFYDYAPGTETLYEQLTLINSKNPSEIAASVGTMDFDSECYMAGFPIGTGPNANCGIYPQQSTTAVKRTAGWHVLSISFGSAYVSISIDGTVVHSVEGNYTFDTISIGVYGPSYRPDTVAYFDDFAFTPLSY